MPRTTVRRASASATIVALAVTALPMAAPTALAAPAAAIEPDVVVAADGDTSFGRATALDGDTMAVAGCEDIADECAGAVYILVRSGGGWVEQAKLRPSDSAVGDEFGKAIAISGDTVVVGSSRDAGEEVLNTGSAYVFQRTGTEWTQQAKLLLTDSQEWDYYGESVALDGDTLVVGAYGREVAGDPVGAAYVYVRSGSSWARQAQVVSPTPDDYDNFGAAVAVEGNTLLVGAPGANTSYVDAGKVDVFTRTGTTWRHRTTLDAPDAANNDALGASLALDGGTAAVGTNRFWEGRRERAYVYVGAGAAWALQARFLCTCDDDDFGAEVDVSGDTVVVAARAADGYAGAAYVYQRDGTQWSKRARLVAPDSRTGRNFGSGVAVDGQTLVVGASTPRQGRAYVYEGPG